MINHWEFKFTGNNMVEIWDGIPDTPENHCIVCVNLAVIPSLVAALKRAMQSAGVRERRIQ